MMKQIVIIFIVLIPFIVFGQKDTLLTVDGSPVLLEEFKAIYNKNNKNEEKTEKALKEYLELFINFKLKVHEAKVLGLDTVVAFKKELAGYRNQLAQPYLTDKNVTESLIQEAYDRMKFEVRASHLLLLVGPDASSEDTLRKYNEIQRIRKQITDKASFEKMAITHSEDKSVQKNKGDLGYFSSLYMVYPFENAAFNTKVGEISLPIRTQFGYHLLYVHDKRPARGSLTTAHIMVKAKKTDDKEIHLKAKQKIDEIYGKLQSGGDFIELAQKFSDDKNSALRGGELPPFTSGKMVPEYEEAAFALKTDNAISKPVMTDYGWHIIKRIKLDNLGSFEDMYNVIKNKVAKDSRSNRSKEVFIDKVKNMYDYSQQNKEIVDFYSVVDTSIYVGAWSAESAKKLTSDMCNWKNDNGDERILNQKEFALYLEKRQPRGNKKISPKKWVDESFKVFVSENLLKYEDAQLSSKYPEFRLLMNEYRDGILLFELTDQKVWSKAVKDTIGLAGFFKDNETNYMTGERYSAVIFKTSNREISNDIVKYLNKNKESDYQKVVDEFNKNTSLNVSYEEGKYGMDEHPALSKQTSTKGKYQVNKDGVDYVVWIKDVLPSVVQEIDQVKGLVTSDYQNVLEKRWIEELRGKYKVSVNDGVLKKVHE